jgi:hypothetical protein
MKIKSKRKNKIKGPSAKRRIPSAPRWKPGVWADCGGGVRVEQGVRLRLRDGTTLVSDHYHPPGGPDAGPAPTLLVRQPYGRAIATTVVYAQPEWFARQGYHVVIQDVRGRGDSDGEFYPFRHEGADGAETIARLLERPEGNGRVGMYGFSYQGLTQLLAAAEQPPGLACIAPAQTAGDLHAGWFYQGGALRLAGTVGWALQLMRADVRRRGPARLAAQLEAAVHQLPGLVAHAPTNRVPGLTARAAPRYFADWVKHAQPGPYWQALDISTRHDRITVPGLHLAGWHDPYLAGSVALFEALAAGPARDWQYLVAGPWVHIPWGRFAGETDFGPEAEPDTDALLLRWFDHWLKDAGTFAAEPRVRLFAQGENRWHHAGEWPPAGRAAQTLFLRSGGRANSARGDGRLEAEAPAGEEPRDGFACEPEVPVASPGPGGAPGQFNQARAAQLNNVLVYTGAPLARRLHVCGTPRVRLFAQSTAPETDFVAKLVRVTPDGRAMNVSLGIARSQALFRAPRHRANAVQRWEFPLDPTSCVWSPGDRVRLEVAGGAYPLFDRHPNTRVPPAAAWPRDWRVARQQVLHNAAEPSALELPVLP